MWYLVSFVIVCWNVCECRFGMLGSIGLVVCVMFVGVLVLGVMLVSVLFVF